MEIYLTAVVGVGGYTYLLEPLWWTGMITSKYAIKVQLALSLSHIGEQRNVEMGYLRKVSKFVDMQ